jgi:mannan endo-1,4-beta-mannosidase
MWNVAPAGAAPNSGFVTRSGTKLILKGNTYRFTGLNIYNANSDGACWYAMNAGSTLPDSLASIGSGKEVFRAWFFQSMATKNGHRDWSSFDHTLAVAAARGVRVIATLTNQWGDCEQGGYKDEAWYTGGYQQQDPGGTVSYQRWATEVAKRYRGSTTVLAWQLVNEAEVKPSLNAGCSIGAEAILESFATDMAGRVKAVDPRHLVSLGTLGGGQCGAQGSEYQDLYDIPSIDLCEYHDYTPNEPMPGDQWNGLQVRLDQCGGGTLQDRADAFNAKFSTQFAAGVVGELAWAWDKDGSTLSDYDIGPGDPALGVLGNY